MKSLDNFDSARFAFSKASRVAENSEFLAKALASPKPSVRRTLTNHIKYFRTILERRTDLTLMNLGCSVAGLTYYFVEYAQLDANGAEIYAHAAASLIEDGCEDEY